MKLYVCLSLLALTLALLIVALTTRDLVSNTACTHCRLAVLSPTLKTKVTGSKVNFREVVQVEVSGNELDSDLLSAAGASNVRHGSEGSPFVVRASLNTVLNISSLPSVSYIQEAVDFN